LITDLDGAPDAAAAETFRAAFNEVWDRIPATDRDCMLDYWSTERYITSPSDSEPMPVHRPVIRLVDRQSDSQLTVACTKFGLDMTFPAALVRGPRDVLLREIGDALVYVYRNATSEHWALLERMIEGPLRRWERAQSSRVTDKDRNRVLDVLEEKYDRRYQVVVTRLLRRWGFEEPRSPKRRPSTKRGKEEA
jgi:hypothetical protein